MYDPSNPYAAPTADIHPVAAQWLGSHSISLSNVAKGLGTIYASIVVVLIGIMIIVAMTILKPEGQLAMNMFAGVGLMFIVAAILNLVGSLFCLATPEETGARGMIYVSVGTLLLEFILIGIQMLREFRVIGELPPGLNTAQAVLMGISTFSFILFLRQLAKFIGRPDLAGRGVGVLVYFAILIALRFGLEIYARAGGQLPIAPWMILPITIGVIVACALALILYSNLVLSTRKAILGGGLG